MLVTATVAASVLLMAASPGSAVTTPVEQSRLFVAVETALAPVSATARLSAREASLVAQINAARAAHGVPPLAVDASLARAARAHSLSMLHNGFFDHGNFAARIRRFGGRGATLGENIAWGSGPYGTARGLVNQWLASPPHRANLLRRGFRRIGVGAVVGRFSGVPGATVATADFAG